MDDDLDPIIHAPARLRIMSTLVALGTGTSIAFPQLRTLLDMTAGNLSTHLAKLEQAGYVSQEKTFSGRTPVTYIAVTRRGALAFDDYVDALRAIVGSAPTAQPDQTTTSRGK